jgi:hypothetical protein
MNLQIHHVVSDITGVTGLRIIEAVLSGERDPAKLAALRDGRIKASEESIVQSLVGDYRREHLFTLRQSLMAGRNYQKLMKECDREVEQYLTGFDAKIDALANPPRCTVETSIPTSRASIWAATCSGSLASI